MATDPSTPTITDSVGFRTLEIMESAVNYNNQLLQLIKPYLHGEVIEIGAGTGTFTSLFLSSGLKITASDVNAFYLSRIHSLCPKAKTRILDIQARKLPSDMKSCFDGAVALNVIEHLPRHSQALKNIFQLLRPGGLAVILVPAHPAAYGLLDERLGHIRRYTQPLLTQIVSSAGLRIVFCRHFNILGLVGWWLNSKILRRPIIPQGQLAIFDYACSITLALEKILPPKIGLSLLCVARKV